MLLHRFANLALLLSATLLTAACGSDDPDGSGGSPPGTGGEGGDVTSGGGGPGGAGGAGGAGGEGGSSTNAVDPAEALFAGTSIPRFEITLTQNAIAALDAEPYEYVKGDLRVELNGEAIDLVDVGVRIKGKAGSFRTIYEKCAFLLNFDKFTDDQTLLGLDKLAVNNMVQDPSMIHERVGYTLFRGMDVAAPRAAHATVYVNGEMYGLYTAVESTDNDTFLNTWFGSDEGNLYEGAYGSDIYVGSEGSFELDKGDDVNFADITELAEALDQMTDPDTFLTDVAEVIDIEAYLRFAATEIYVGHWDGYAYWQNNYYIYRRPSDSRWVFIPWGIDQTFSDYMDPFSTYARVQNMCTASLPCRQRLAQTYEEVIARASDLDLVGLATGLEPFLWDAVLDDPRKELDAGSVSSSMASTIDFLTNRPADVMGRLGCVDPEGVDLDGDGASGCGYDCNDQDASVYPGAPEQCNLADDDCDGVWDNDPSCPQYLMEPAPGGGTLAFSFSPRTWSDAEADCVGQGGHLVSIHDQATQDAVVSTALSIANGDWWIGFNDQDEEGVFTWTDGSPVDYTSWGGGEPNNYNDEEHCGHLTGGGGAWNDLTCYYGARYVCRLP
ncbi:CotH kinase family protein [Chondromyces apiculatus]|uniref:C-type lectin domain-containing protein n=1 Tax=Chondromyces apiculatus DSM 436 TaxID=1192034 RepID=A0A017T3N8_9BACT|nr:CotH kinase family protein [Chondromyces apiculatus]EYF03863.1 Hypothetical protein CAP_5127 [Chondromyces apiculatus DSM 436]